MSLNRKAILTGGTLGVVAAAATGMARAQQMSGSLTAGSPAMMWRTKVGASGDVSADAFGQFAPKNADIGYIQVPADHFAPAGATKDVYALRFARFAAQRPTDDPPLFFFYGGPTRLGNDLWYLLDGGGIYHRANAALIDTVTRHCDFVLIDQRGSAGCLYPRLPIVAIESDIPLDRPVSLDERNTILAGGQRRLVQYWAAAGVDLGLINARQAACDVDAVRAALGYRKIRLSGDSNGTYRIREYLRRFQANVDSALMFISHAYVKAPRPEWVKAAFNRIDASFAADVQMRRRIGSLGELLDDLTRKLDASPVTVPVKSPRTGRRESIVMTGLDIAVYFWYVVSYNESIRQAPGKFWRIRNGKYDELAAVAAAARTPGPSDATLMGSAYEVAFSGTALPTSDVFADYRRTAGSATYLNREIEPGSGSWPLAHDDHSPFEHTVPITYVQGSWDCRCPLEGARSVGGRNVTFVVNPNMGHENTVDGDPNGKLWDVEMVESFLTGRQIDPYRGFGSQFDAEEFA